jgi:hypothetical protein
MVKQIANRKPEDYLRADIPYELMAGYKKQKEIFLASFKSKTNAWLEYPFTDRGWGMCILLKPFSHGSVNINPADPLGDQIFGYRIWSLPSIRTRTFACKSTFVSTCSNLRLS